MKFTCQICVESKNKSKLFACESCLYEVCKDCQKRYLLPSCMNCHAEFTRKNMIDTLGITFVNTVLRGHEEKCMMDHERSLLPSMQGSVDQARITKEQTELSRFQYVARRQAITSTVVNHMFETPNLHLACPKQDCRGYVLDLESWKCGICSVSVCKSCHNEITNVATHQCNVDDVTSIQLLLSDSKDCPSCHVPIFRSEGCSHMHCTYCGADFDWKSMKIIKVTTNHHYNNVANISESTSRAVIASCSSCSETIETNEDAIPLEAQNLDVMDAEFLRSLYQDLSVVRFTRRSIFKGDDFFDSSLHDSRLKFIMGDINDMQWTRRVFGINKARRRSGLQSRVLDLYVLTAQDFQRLLFRCQTDLHVQALKREWIEFIRVCNDSFRSLKSEFGGSLLILKSSLRDVDEHPLVFC